MLAGLSTRRYARGLEPVGEQVEAAASGTSRSAVSRRFVQGTQAALTELMSADLSELDLVAFMVDGVGFGEHTCVVALGITIDGTKVPLAIEHGSTENATLARSLIVGLRERGLDTTRPVLAVLDGSKALRRAVLDVFDHPVLARCQQHKIRNVRDRLPDTLRTLVEQRMRRAYHADSALAAQAQLEALAAELDKTHPGAATSLREGMAETLTVIRLGVPPTLARTLRSTNPIWVDDRDLPGTQQERQALAGRHHGPALGRRRHDRGPQAVPPRQRPPAPARPARRSRTRDRTDCQYRGARSDQHRSLTTGRCRSSTELGTTSIVNTVKTAALTLGWSG